MIRHANRREFLATSSLVSLGMLTGCAQAESEAPAEAESSALPYDGVLGLQLYTVRDLFEKDARATLEALAEIGVKDCETAGLYEHDVKDVRAIMDDLGMFSRSAHASWAAMEPGLEEQFEIAKVLGQSNIYLSWIPEEQRTPDGYRELADLLNKRGEEAKTQGLKMGYHNHEFEFLPQDEDGTTGYDIILERTDPDLVTLELDFFWAHLAKVDPLALFERAPGRFTSCHIKDSTAEGDMVAVGDGIIDFATLINAGAAAGMDRFYVEHDNPAEPLVSVQRSFTHLMG